jgi:DNA-directed RNA polymerase subunit RPC12/RpoP
MTQKRPCARCRAETERTVIDSTAGEADPLAISIHGMPVLACPRGHVQFVHNEFPRRLLERLLEEDEARLPAGEEKGVLFKHFRCSNCGTELAHTPDHRETFAVDVALQDASPFKVELTMPVYRCPECEKEQIHSLKEIRKHTPQALAHAFQAADIPPA